VGLQTRDDAGTLLVRDDLAICFTADFITPLVDDPGDWGRIAAANSISDIYAMGARPLAALNLVGWPGSLPLDVLGRVLAGGAQTARAAGCLIVGGHTIEDKEPKYGMAVIGTAEPGRIVRNRGALPGDLLYLTKPLGTGIVTTALKADSASEEEIAAAVAAMTTLGGPAAEAALAAEVRAMTDVTGFGLIGHLSEMLGDPPAVGAELSVRAIPTLPGAEGQMAMGLIPAGAYRNRTAFAGQVDLNAAEAESLEMLLYDPQTSGGLLMAIPPQAGPTFEAETRRRGVTAWRIGSFNAGRRIRVDA